MKNNTTYARHSEVSAKSIVRVRKQERTVVSRPGAIRIWSPDPDQIHGLLGESIATSLAAAFSSREWSRTPMPIGNCTDPHSARGILAQLAGRSQAVLASEDEPAISLQAQRVVGCVLGGVLDEALIAAYGLQPYGAREGDGLLAYIGVVPAAQGMRLRPHDDGIHEAARYRVNRMAKTDSTSLASLLFSGWLALPIVRSCPAVFVRTRQVPKPIIHLAAKNGFEFSGCFTVDFHGERQDRMVFRRELRVA